MFIYNTHGDVAFALEGTFANQMKAYLYEAYGKVYSNLSDFYEDSFNDYDEMPGSPILYAGQYYDAESGMYYLRARYYSPDLKKFTQEDPIRDGMNWYAYCSGNPVKYVDPSGLAVEILYHSGSKLSNSYGHIDISVNGTVYSFALYNTSSKLYGKGSILVVDADTYIEKRRNEGRTITAFTLNFTDEQETALEGTLQSYYDTSEKPVESDKYSEGKYYYPDETFGTGTYFAGGQGFGYNCVTFVQRALVDTAISLTQAGETPSAVFNFDFNNGGITLPAEAKTKLYEQYIYSLLGFSDTVTGVRTLKPTK